jgi:HNH endonuclease
MSPNYPVSAVEMVRDHGVDRRTFRRALRAARFPWHGWNERWTVERGSPEHQQMLGVLDDLKSGRTVREPSTTFIDQHSLLDAPGEKPMRYDISSSAFKRDRLILNQALARANGACEYCLAPGFVTASGKIYLETHHIVPLAKRGADSLGNVTALCPNHHREAHHGSNREAIRAALATGNVLAKVE